MKKFLAFLFLLLLLPALCWAAGTSSVSSTTDFYDTSGKVTKKLVTISWAGDASDGTVPNLTINPATYNIRGWYWYEAVTNPGTTAPTNLYDITVSDADGVDISGALLNNLSSTSSERINLGRQVNSYPAIKGSWTWSLANNSQTSATGTCALLFVEN